MNEAVLTYDHDTWAYFYFFRRQRRAKIEWYKDGEFEYDIDLPLKTAKDIYSALLKEGYEKYE